MTDLFPDAVSLSPRQAWLNRHGLTLTRSQTGRYYIYLDSDNKAGGRTKDEACWRFARKFKVKHWLEEDLENDKSCTLPLRQ